MQHTSDFIGKVVTVKVDRPLGSKHPEYGLIYTLNYGYVPGVMAPDGEELDAYFWEYLNHWGISKVTVLR